MPRKKELLTKLLKVGMHRGQWREEQIFLAVMWRLPFIKLYSQIWVC